MKEWTRKRKADIVMGIILQVYFLVPWIHHHTMYGYLYQALKMNDYVRTYNEMLLPSLKKIWGYTKPTAFLFLVHSFMSFSPILLLFSNYSHKFLICFYFLDQEFSKYPYKYPFQHNITEPQSDTVLNICFLYT